ncbi:hypothetical protein KAF25_005420 [Fusarium avenaceum]|uniref:Ig-like domain-containing protein n=1 Tax=Fusarium avenaceum TaxID=40199 RepID=A0A9P7H3U7_9HYPO|nr:hypothetical protein KAF25_005420 [Fusarium avenaceum]
MRYNLFLLAVGFYVADSVVAGPCKPSGSTSEQAAISTILTTSTIALPETTSILEATTTTIVSEDTTTLNQESETSETASAATTYNAETTSTIALPETTSTLEATTTTIVSEDTTTLNQESETSETTSAATTYNAETTSTAPATQPTYVLSASGGGLNGAQPQGNGQPGTFIAFDPSTLSGAVPRKFTIEPITGRLQDAESRAYVCAYYDASSTAASPSFIVFCGSGPTGAGQQQDYLTCNVNNGNLACTAPRTYCSSNDDEETICSTPTDDLYNSFFTDAQKFWYISSGSPQNFSPIVVSAQKQR